MCNTRKAELLANSETGRKGRLGTALAAYQPVINFNVRKALGSLFRCLLPFWEVLGSLFRCYSPCFEALGSLVTVFLPVSRLSGGSREPLDAGFRS